MFNWLFKIILRCLLLLDAETAHTITLFLLKHFYRPWMFTIKIDHPVDTLGLHFPNPIGIAAGFDKNGECIDALFSLGFGFVEVGAVTPKPQPGKPKPRLFRIPEAQAVINRMGFNNKGVDYLVAKLKARKSSGIVGVNLGKNLDTPLEQAASDYCTCMQKVYPYCDFVTVNISSPNTLGLRDLQSADYLDALLKKLKRCYDELIEKHQRRIPILLKLSPDLSNKDLISCVNLCIQYKIDGIIATNTTIDKTLVKNYKNGNEEGGLSGSPLLERSNQVVREIRSITGKGMPIIGVGGITSAEDAREKLNAGANLIQIYTGLVYQGPELLQKIKAIL